MGTHASTRSENPSEAPSTGPSGRASSTPRDVRRASSGDRAAANPRLEPGTLLEETYRIDHLIAAGGMGEVYHATHARLGGAFAVKVLHRELLRDESLLARFEAEAKVMASFRHPNVVQVFDFNYTPSGTPYLVMELAEGPDLRTVLTEERQLSPWRVARIVEQTASALGAAHAHGIIHRDLKPENVMLVPIDGQSECVKVVDFGISKSTRERSITLQATVIGTPEYMSPEQAQGLNDEVDHRTDQFALGGLAYMLLTGSEPFRGQTPVSVLYQVVHEQPKALGQLVDWPCERVEAVLRQAMAKDRNDRYPNILDFARAFGDAVAADLAGTPDAARLTPRAMPVPPPPEERELTSPLTAPSPARPASAPERASVRGRRGLRLSSELDLPLATASDLPTARRGLRAPERQPAASGAVDAASSRRARPLGRARRPVDAPPGRRPGRRPPRPWRLAAMALGAACVAAATFAFGTAAPVRSTFTSAGVSSVYDAVSVSATRFLHLGPKLGLPVSATE